MRRSWIAAVVLLGSVGCARHAISAHGAAGTSTGSTTSTGTTSGSSGASTSGGSTSTGSAGSTGASPCDSPIPIAFDQPLSGDTTEATDHFHPVDAPCTGYFTTGPDVLYAFTPSATGYYAITVTPGATFDAAVYVLGACPTSADDGSACVGGADAYFKGEPETVDLQLTGGRTYFIVVDSNDPSEEGPFTLRVANGLPPPANDACQGAQMLGNLDGPGSQQSVQGTTFASKNDATGSCGGSGPDVVYAVSPTQDVSLTAVVTTPDGGLLDPVLYLRHTCDDPQTELGCRERGRGVPVQLIVPLVPADGGAFYLWVDGFGGTSGPFTLDVSLAAPIATPSNDRCASPQPFAMTSFPDGGMGGSASFDTTWADDTTSSDSSGSCHGDGLGPDLVYRLSLSTPVPGLTAAIQAVPDAGDQWPVVYLRSAPCFDALYPDGGAPAGEIACGDRYTVPDGGPAYAATFQAGPLDAGEYFIWVDSLSGSKGPGTLEITAP